MAEYNPSVCGTTVGGDLTVHGNLVNIVNARPQASTAEMLPFRYKLPVPTPHFYGRATILDGILEHFTAESNQLIDCWGKMVALGGLAGMGKSETASHFANNYRDIYPNVAWIDAQTQQGALDSFLGFAKSRGIVSEHTQKADVDLVKRVYRHIDEHCHDNVLFIFDNALKLHSDERDFGIFDFLPTEDLANRRFPFVIITSQASNWPRTIRKFQLSELNVEDSLSFFRSSFDVSSSKCDEAFKRLHIHLQGYPLAMTLAACDIDFESQKDSHNWLQEQIDLFIQKFQNEDSSILTQKINQNWPSPYNKTLSSVWQLSLQRLQNEPHGEDAFMLLQAVSFFHIPVTIEDVRWVFIECPYCPGTPDWMKNDRVKESIRLLQKFHLVDCVFETLKYSEDLKALQNNTEINSEDLPRKFEEQVKSAKSFWCELRAHRLVQLVVRLRMDRSEVLEDILRFLAFWGNSKYVRQLNVSAVDEALGRVKLSTRALAFVGLLALKGNPVARRIFQTAKAPMYDPAATIWRIFHLDKSIDTLNEEAIKVLRSFIGLSTSENTLIDKRCFADMALEMLCNRKIFPYMRDDGTWSPGILLRSFTEIEYIACKFFSTCCSFTDVCSLHFLCMNELRRCIAADQTVFLGNGIIHDLNKSSRWWRWTQTCLIVGIIFELHTYREFLNQGRNKSKLTQYVEDLAKLFASDDSWKKFECEVKSCGFDQLKLKQVFSSIFNKIWSATSNKNFTESNRVGYALFWVNCVVYRFLKTPRSREILIPLTESFIEILVKTEKEQLSVLEDPRENRNSAVIWICSTWMNIAVQEGGLSSNNLSGCLSRVRIPSEMKNIPIDMIRVTLQSFMFWKKLLLRHEKVYDKFLQMYSESSVEEILTLVTFCKEIQHEMLLVVKQFGYQT